MQSKDTHPADIAAALRKVGLSLRKLSMRNGYNVESLKSVMKKPWPRAEQIVAEALGTDPQKIWPSRYRRNGRPKVGRSVSAGSSRTSKTNVCA